MPTEISTLCFHTRDAIDRDDSSLTFTMPSDPFRNSAAKVSLASCEFPMVQWTVEEPWNRLWMQEGIRVGNHNNFMDISVRLPTDLVTSEMVVRLHIPLRYNPIVSATPVPSGLQVVCKEPHGLTGSAKDSRLIGGEYGDVRLGDDFKVLSDTTFRVKCIRASKKYSHLFTPLVASPVHLCALLTASALQSTELRELTTTIVFRYDTCTDHVLMNVQCNVKNTMVCVLSTGLSRACGLSTVGHRVDTVESTQWPCESTTFWDYVEMPLGFYSPCHRPMCVGQPMRFGSELEMAHNRFYFPLRGNDDPDHLVIFTDPENRILSCSIPPGRYTPEQISLHLEATMTSIAQQEMPTVSYTVQFNDDCRFVFSCELKYLDQVFASKFGILFHHPLSVDPTRFGFPAQAMFGSSTYVSPQATRVFSMPNKRRACNVLRVSEISSQKRFRFHAVSPPLMVGVVEGKTDSIVRVRTYVNGKPFAHGCQVGDIVRISKSDALTTGTAPTPKVCPCDIPPECSCAALQEDNDVCLLNLSVPPLLDGIQDIGVCFQVSCDLEPWSLHFGKPKSLPAHCVGFAEAAVLWGIDGSISDDDGRYLPPFEAPYSFCLEHPDYILMTFSESSGGTFEHSFRGERKQIFCKLSLYPLFREERMLPRDTTLMKNSLTRFTVAFWNPDMKTPYKFHGAQFSFSLNFLVPVPS